MTEQLSGPVPDDAQPGPVIGVPQSLGLPFDEPVPSGGRTVWDAALAAAAGRRDEAVGILERLIGDRPDSASLRREMGRLLLELDRGAEAVDHFREALFLDPADAGTAISLSQALLRQGEAAAAVEVAQMVLRREPDRSEALLAAARAWLALEEPAKAERLLLRCLDADPEDRGGARALLAGMMPDRPAELSRIYVRALFDGYADRFEAHLTGRLGYRAPELLRAAVDAIGGRRTGLAVLDAGCGTGLAGAAFRDLAARLHGADLSPRMAAKAAARGIYDHVEVAEFSDALRARPGAWDLVLAADVLVYLGDLGGPLAAVADGLAPGGLFAATVEAGTGDGYVLGPARRYAHGPEHVCRRAAEAGLVPHLFEEVSARTERGKPVPGYLFVLGKPG